MNKESGSVDGNGLMAMDKKLEDIESRIGCWPIQAAQDITDLLAHIDRLLRLPSREQVRDGLVAVDHLWLGNELAKMFENFDRDEVRSHGFWNIEGERLARLIERRHTALPKDPQEITTATPTRD